METRKCKSCDYEGSEDTFPNAGTIKGIKYYRHICKRCYRVQKDVEKNKRVALYREYKETLECERCGYDDHRALQFHHTNGDKEAAVSELAQRRSLSRVLEEIAKCEVLCANCHQIEHYTGT